ncbi:hypothetical protein KIN20_024362 [Parelaphostrongylus tenuis]|uniref:Reverse transcriptase domain-containing protein n=1 Tax=Parelaphostrongylus tenuis TaxID=148309 RepID=A0AAD5QW92_PARTN|nr:hypothetical protein KIN20_024362 [Parelaphostrongylus tenuis]
MEPFDVSALYTNVSNESAMQAICELLTEHERTTNMYGFSIRQVYPLFTTLWTAQFYICSAYKECVETAWSSFKSHYRHVNVHESSQFFPPIESLKIPVDEC